jgi:hypothetical protein
MTTIRDNSRKPDPQGDDQTQPSKPPGEIENGEVGTTQAQGQRGVTTPSQPGRNERQDPNEDVEGSDDQDEDEDEDEDEGDDEDLPPPDPQRTGRGESQRRGNVTE